MQETEPVLLFDSCCCTASLLLPTIERLGLFADKPERETADAVATLCGDMRSEMSTCSQTTPEEEVGDALERDESERRGEVATRELETFLAEVGRWREDAVKSKVCCKSEGN